MVFCSNYLGTAYIDFSNISNLTTGQVTPFFEIRIVNGGAVFSYLCVAQSSRADCVQLAHLLSAPAGDKTSSHKSESVVNKQQLELERYQFNIVLREC